jgi:hypothetical protein
VPIKVRSTNQGTSDKRTGKEKEKDLALCSQTLARSGTPDCPVVHQTVSGAPGWSSVNSPLSGFDGGVRLKFTELSGEPTVASATVYRVARTNGRLGTSDCPVCQSTPRTNGRMRLIWKAIAHRTATVTVRWCTGLSGAPPNRRQVWPSKLASNGS